MTTLCQAASTPEAGPIAQRFEAQGRVLLLVVTFGNVVGLCSNIAASVYTARAASYSDAAAAAFNADNAAEGMRLSQLVNPSFNLADIAQSVQQFCEVVVLLIIIVAFTVVGVAFARVANHALRNLKLAAAGDREAAGADCVFANSMKECNTIAAARIDEFSSMRSGSESVRLAAAAGNKGRKLWWQVVLTVTVVFVTFLLRAIYSFMQGNFSGACFPPTKRARVTRNAAVSNALQNSGNCSSNCAYPCNNIYALIQVPHLSFCIPQSVRASRACFACVCVA